MSIAEPVTYDLTKYEETWDDDDEVHLFCDCDPLLAFCGEDLSNAPELPVSEFSREDVCDPCKKVEIANRRRCPWGHLPSQHP